MEKAFTSVNWDFLFRLLEFGAKWINWLRYCITTVRISVIINGAPNGFFPTQKGLSHGDPLLPCFFILAMEKFSLTLKKAAELKWLEGFIIEDKNGCKMGVSHILYANDKFVMCKADQSQLLHRKSILLLSKPYLDYM